ncbi:hypothetical protein DFH06DRAFT_1432631 [Mycena polygramma]|nr:hypothetical protein DFH06DRAFT_1432631 [Mycena polygramma]
MVPTRSSLPSATSPAAQCLDRVYASPEMTCTLAFLSVGLALTRLAASCTPRPRISACRKHYVSAEVDAAGAHFAHHRSCVSSSSNGAPVALATTLSHPSFRFSSTAQSGRGDVARCRMCRWSIPRITRRAMDTLSLAIRDSCTLPQQSAKVQSPGQPSYALSSSSAEVLPERTITNTSSRTPARESSGSGVPHLPSRHSPSCACSSHFAALLHFSCALGPRGLASGWTLSTRWSLPSPSRAPYSAEARLFSTGARVPSPSPRIPPHSSTAQTRAHGARGWGSGGDAATESHAAGRDLRILTVRNGAVSKHTPAYVAAGRHKPVHLRVRRSPSLSSDPAPTRLACVPPGTRTLRASVPVLPWQLLDFELLRVSAATMSSLPSPTPYPWSYRRARSILSIGLFLRAVVRTPVGVGGVGLDEALIYSGEIPGQICILRYTT